MYHPYFRGKQYELITVREMAPVLAASKFTPIIEPVRESLQGLEKALNAVCEAKGQSVVITNPFHGDLAEDGGGISQLLSQKYLKSPHISAGILLNNEATVNGAVKLARAHEKHGVTFVHAGFKEPRALADAFGAGIDKFPHVFVEALCGKLYRRHFGGESRVLLGDGFERRRNRDHPDVEPFSDLHVTFADEGMTGFGDFLIVGDEYSESGGPAYAVAIHLTFINAQNDDEMWIYHFKSKRQDTPTDPAGKFAEALDAMIKKLDSGTSQVLETEAVKEFRELHAKRHFPGLGYVKKLSMKHHIETLADYFSK